MNPVCNYCENESELVGGESIYPHRPDLFSLKFYKCDPCDAYVGTHKNTKNHEPLGRLANKDLRAAKQAAHRAFDPMWRDHYMKRKEAYKWLADALEIDVKDCHIGMFSESTCIDVVFHVNKYWSGKQ